VLDAELQRPVQRIAQTMAVQEFLAQQGSEQTQSGVEDGTFLMALADGTVAGPGTGFRCEILRRESVGHRDCLTWSFIGVPTVSYSGVR
jgi:hypothetical protein